MPPAAAGRGPARPGARDTQNLTFNDSIFHNAASLLSFECCQEALSFYVKWVRHLHTPR